MTLNWIEAPIKVQAAQWTGDLPLFQEVVPKSWLAEGNRVGAEVGTPVQSRVFLNINEWAVAYPDGHVVVMSDPVFRSKFVEGTDTELTISSLEPSSAAVGDPDLTLRVLGTGFTNSSQIIWNGSPEATTFVTDAELTTGVKPSTASGPYTIPISVRDMFRESNEVTFEFTEAAPLPEEDTRRGKRNA